MAFRDYLLSNVHVDPPILTHLCSTHLLTVQCVLDIGGELQGLLFKVKGSKITSFLVDSTK